VAGNWLRTVRRSASGSSSSCMRRVAGSSAFKGPTGASSRPSRAEAESWLRTGRQRLTGRHSAWSREARDVWHSRPTVACSWRLTPTGVGCWWQIESRYGAGKSLKSCPWDSRRPNESLVRHGVVDRTAERSDRCSSARQSRVTWWLRLVVEEGRCRVLDWGHPQRRCSWPDGRRSGWSLASCEGGAGSLELKRSIA
jgi:hypothetical protein